LLKGETMLAREGFDLPAGETLLLEGGVCIDERLNLSLQGFGLLFWKNNFALVAIC
jgi:hypothetical protein